MQETLKRWFATLFLILLASNSWAELRIEITQGAGRRAPVAVVPFGWQGGQAVAPLDIADVIGADLSRSGRFAPIAVDDMLQLPTTGVDVDFDDWSILGVEAVVVGRVTQTGDNAYSVQFQLFDVFKHVQLVGYRMPASRGTMRRVAHRAADMIFEKLTGIQGVFATQIAYVTAQGSGRNRLFTLVVSDSDGENEHTIMESTDPIMSPAWSPDSRRLAYVSFEGDRSTVFVQTLRTGNRIKVSDRQGINGAPAFSPDGRKLVLTLGGADGNLDVFVMDIATKAINRLTTNRAIDTEGTWSPDGKHVFLRRTVAVAHRSIGLVLRGELPSALPSKAVIMRVLDCRRMAASSRWCTLTGVTTGLPCSTSRTRIFGSCRSDNRMNRRVLRQTVIL